MISEINIEGSLSHNPTPFLYPKLITSLSLVSKDLSSTFRKLYEKSKSNVYLYMFNCSHIYVKNLNLQFWIKLKDN